MINGLEARFDAPPRTDEERRELLGALLEQARELIHVEAKVTCPCGCRPTLVFAFHCFHCGLWFCGRCSRRHFGPAPTTPD